MTSRARGGGRGGRPGGGGGREGRECACLVAAWLAWSSAAPAIAILIKEAAFPQWECPAKMSDEERDIDIESDVSLCRVYCSLAMEVLLNFSPPPDWPMLNGRPRCLA